MRLSLSEAESYKAVPAGRAVANNGRTHGQEGADRRDLQFQAEFSLRFAANCDAVLDFAFPG